jgi:hypothetical protein
MFSALQWALGSGHWGSFSFFSPDLVIRLSRYRDVQYFGFQVTGFKGEEFRGELASSKTRGESKTGPAPTNQLIWLKVTHKGERLYVRKTNL